ncbi:MAG TPA: hypothetical protein VEK79_12285 [Thermoanaerobaculia bacterium]|nr:hypothetical protein [Thermoanaerobaculia bacterium]
MTYRIFFFVFSFFFVSHVHAALVRVMDVVDGRTLVIERRGAAETVQLAGIALTDDNGARTMMKWTLVSTWVMLEVQPDGGYFVYRSPDALFVNRELVQRGFARATLPTIEPAQHVIVTYLGTMNVSTNAPNTRAARGNGSGSTPPRPAKPTRPHRARAAR